MHHHHHHHRVTKLAWISLTFPLSLSLSLSLSRHSSQLSIVPGMAGLLDYILCPSRVVVGKVLLVSQHWHVYVKWSIEKRYF